MLEWGDTRKPWAAWEKNKRVLGNWGLPKGGYEAWRRASCTRLAFAQLALTLLVWNSLAFSMITLAYLNVNTSDFIVLAIYFKAGDIYTSNRTLTRPC